MKPDLNLAQFSQFSLTQAQFDALRSDYEEQVDELFAKYRNVTSVGIGVHTGHDGASLPAIVVTLEDPKLGPPVPQRGRHGTLVVTEIGGVVAPHALEFAEPGTEVGQTPYQRMQYPVPCGVSTGPSGQNNIGTLGYHARMGKKKYLLSNNHVLSRCGRVAIGTPVTQPAEADMEHGSPRSVATLSYVVPLTRNETATADAAIAEYGDKIKLAAAVQRDGAEPVPLGTCIVLAEPNLNVVKSGRTTGFTEGTVVKIGCTVRVGYWCGEVTMTDVIEIMRGDGSDKFSDAGDSGAPVTTEEGNDPVGMLFGGGTRNGKQVSHANPIHRVLTALSAVTPGPVTLLLEADD
ncbi:hypothetical protein GCM10027277_43720 [Pseudoduganella ginsengisoli]|uniref:Serine protease n=1 Tax=Pseudoduganella ginsengisoli TaxID=1462440 RepID=A0A6L6Q1Y0_9BURK|nr:hypothetical protein [Pseudoduganella ginsengisoli]MTW03827.1 hypothetical protein [Pseudoduganella ginsengisoli]